MNTRISISLINFRAFYIMAILAITFNNVSAQSQDEEANKRPIDNQFLEDNVVAQDPFYRIKPGDTVNIRVFNENDMGIQQRLDVDGSLVLPIIGRVVLSQMTIRESEAFLEKKYIDEQILINPQVSISISNYTGEVFYVYGEVTRPGAKAFPPGRQSIDILEAITLAGDLSQYAKRSEIILRKTDPVTGKEEKITIDFDRILRGTGSEKLSDFKVMPGDILFIPERLF